MWLECFAVFRFKINTSWILVVAERLYFKKSKEAYRHKERKNKEEMGKDFMKETPKFPG